MLEETGKTKTSRMVDTIVSEMETTIFNGERRVMMQHLFVTTPTDIVIFDLKGIAQGKKGKKVLDNVYLMAEHLKDGRIMDTLKEPRMVWFKPPHVIILANSPPDMTKWSKDRYAVITL